MQNFLFFLGIVLVYRVYVSFFFLEICYGYEMKDALHPFAPYSKLGVSRKEFLLLYKQSLREDISFDTYHQIRYGTLHPTPEEVGRIQKRIDCMRTLFYKKPSFK